MFLPLNKSDNTVNNPFCPIFMNKLFYKSGYEWYMNKPPQYMSKPSEYTVDKNKSGKFSVCKYYWSGDFC